MINRINLEFIEGEIYELGNQSEPLYIWHNGKMVEITPEEYNICTTVQRDDRFFEIWKNRTAIKH